ncbi:hypothetical protein BgiMline_011267, partial [Biomphalaria glabrata]
SPCRFDSSGEDCAVKTGGSYFWFSYARKCEFLKHCNKNNKDVFKTEQHCRTTCLHEEEQAKKRG